MDLLEAIAKRQSVRQYLSDEVPRAVLERIVDAANQAPTGCNLQLKQYLIVDSPALMERIRPCSKAFVGAPAAIFILMAPQASKYGEFWVQDASAAMENMLLAAVALGYAGCWVEGAIRRAETELAALLGVPAELRVWSASPIGKAAELTPRPAKPELAGVVHYNAFGRRT